MAGLLATLSPLCIYIVSAPVTQHSALVSIEQFLATYKEYVRQLQSGCEVLDRSFRTVFSSIFTATPELLCTQSVGEDRWLIRATQPVVQLQPHHFHLSEVDGRFHSMAYGPDAILWGIQFSYPQLFQDPKTLQIHKVRPSAQHGGALCNTPLFATLTSWVRRHTSPTPFLYRGKRVNSPMRLGRGCFRWIHTHPQLVARKIEVLSL